MLHRTIGMFIGPLRVVAFNIYNFLFHVPRARIVIWNERGELLLVRNWGGSRRWNLPGGGVKRNEQPIEAARRELYEEVGVDVPVAQFSYVVTLHYQYEAPIYTVTVPEQALPRRPHNPREITDLRWFPVDELPPDLSPLVPLALKKLSKAE